MTGVGILFGALLVSLAAVVVWTLRAMRWGATPEEIAAAGTGDAWFEAKPSGVRLKMTRAIRIEAQPETVWRWLAQTGRGAGWYSYERLDNGGRASARHLVQWIPQPCVGDAAAIGYLRHLEPGREIVWWGPDTPFLGARTWSAWSYRVLPDVHGSRLVARFDVLSTGAMGPLAAVLFSLIDCIMAVRQLRTLKHRAEQDGLRTTDPDNAENGERDQYQLYEVIYASGEQAGAPGVEGAQASRRCAAADRVV